MQCLGGGAGLGEIKQALLKMRAMQKTNRGSAEEAYSVPTPVRLLVTEGKLHIISATVFLQFLLGNKSAVHSRIGLFIDFLVYPTGLRF